MEISPSDPKTWEYFDTRIKGAIAFAISDTGAMCVFNTCPIFAAYGGGPGIWKPSCNGQMVELQKQGTAPDFSGGGTLVIRKGFEALAEAQRKAHEDAVARRMPIPKAEDIKVPKKSRARKKIAAGKLKTEAVPELYIRRETVRALLSSTMRKLDVAGTDAELDTAMIDLSQELMRGVRPMRTMLPEE